MKNFKNFRKRQTPDPKLQTFLYFAPFNNRYMKATRSSAPAKAPATQAKAPAAKPKAGQLFGKENFTWMLIGVAILILGFVLMVGGGSEDPNVFNASEVYSPRRITIAPIIILLGLAVEIYAIFRQPKNTGTAE